jgi:hypothetical protein
MSLCCVIYWLDSQGNYPGASKIPSRIQYVTDAKKITIQNIRGRTDPTFDYNLERVI